MDQSELSAVSQEIEQIRKEAHAKGYEECKAVYGREREQLRKEYDRVDVLRAEWQTTVKIIQQHYLLTHDSDFKVLNDSGDIFSIYDEDPKLSVPADMDQFQKELARLVRMGRDFEVMLKGINEHEILKGYWDKLLMTFKLIEQ